MPRFSVAFGRRKSTAENIENSPVTESSFRVLERTEVPSGKSFDGGVRLATKPPPLPKTSRSDSAVEDNIFAGLKSHRGSGSSNTTKTVSTDNSSRHSNVSTTPSSADLGGQDEWRSTQRKYATDIPVPPIPKSASAGFLRAAGRTFSFGGQKRQLPSVPAMEEETLENPSIPEPAQIQTYGRSRATTASTATTVTPPRVDGDFDLDLGGDFGKILLLGANGKRASVATLRQEKQGRHPLPPRALTGSRMNQPPPIEIDKEAKVEPPAHSWSSHHSNDQLLNQMSPSFLPPSTENDAPPVPRHASPMASKPPRPSASPEINPRKPLLGAQPSSTEHGEGEDEEARLLKDSLSTVTRFMTGKGSGAAAGSPSPSRYRRNEDKDEDDSLFDTSHTYSSVSANRFTPRTSSPQQGNKVMTPAEFERYRRDKERQDKDRQLDTFTNRPKTDEDEDDNYEEDEDDVEKAKMQAKQRRKQEAHMSVYRQQMMKVTGEAANGPASRPSLSISFSTPNLPNLGSGPNPGANVSDNSDEDEEVPLAILAAHGFPNKNRPPTRLSTMASNPNLRASQQPSYQRPGSVMGDAPVTAAANPRLPAFARNLPQDPFLGAGLVRNSVRESFSFGGGSAAPGHHTGAPPGGLIGVIANEERSRALRRGSPHIDSQNPVPGAVGYDPNGGIPPHMMYQTNNALTTGDQAQLQMTQQMQQFMQMQMQFMQMMTGQNGSANTGPHGHLAAQSMSNLSAMNGALGMGGAQSMLGVPGMQGMGGPETLRHSYLGNDSILDLPSARGDAQLRTMSMVQPSSASWIQPLQGPSFAPSIRLQGGGYAPSIAPSERSNIGLPGRYRPVSHVPPPNPTGPGHVRKSSTMSGSLGPSISVTKSGNASDDDDEEGWEAMKAKREKKKSAWRTKKSISGELGAFIR
ncbi:hypothetical protein B0T25DRAFT_443518 [Lasiosphaeria hispida]|uniref:Uncharacterized protein n=1 Tax=Lasiosphaeria hispida TaxID=260671 RepID=A0AAJ0MJJ1_9PEZI|nr:hypothetical protein B0T25DRAFT_443518 [Lasiosphaeria hispida]